MTVAYPDMPLSPSPAPEEEPVKSLTNQELQALRTTWKKFFGLPSKSSQLRILSRHPVGGGEAVANTVRGVGMIQ